MDRAQADLELIRDHGFTVLGATPGAEEGDHSHDPAKRRRGAGTAAAPNA